MTNKTDVLISIVMPAYNAEDLILDSVNSVINQTYTNWELIIIDDGSVDRTVQVVDELTQEDKRIHLLKNIENKGVAATRNKGIKVAMGDWIAFLDSDDLWRKDKLEKQVNYINEKKSIFLFTGTSFIDSDGKRFQGIFNVPRSIAYKQLRRHNVITTSSVLIKKELLLEVPMEQDDIHEDYVAWLRILNKNILAYGIDEPLTVYRISSDSKSGNRMKSVMMTYRVHRFLGTNPIKSIYYTVNHAIGAFKKFNNLKAP